jgi:crotonobetainyl-CoA:carnitine CoA-transferase CaiB-like acyl-CoA transferase
VADLPLTGLRVLDMAGDKAELCGRLLADLGADVVRLEPPEGAASRRTPPFHAGHSLAFAVRNSNKRGAVVDLASEPGRGRLLDLLARADVFIETTRPGELAALGLAPDRLVERFGHLIVTSITDFGQTGPYRDFEATNDVIVGLAGEIFRSGVVGRPPLLVPGPYAYDVSGVMAAFATLLAYWQRTKDGRGQHIDFSILEATAQMTDWSLPNYSAIKNSGGRYTEIRAGSGVVYPLYPCADGYVRLVILSPRQWHAMRSWLGEPEFLQDEHWDSLLGRMSIQEDILDPMYTELFSHYGMAELSAEAQRRGIVMTPVLHPAAVIGAEHFVARGSFIDVEVAPGVHGLVAASVLEVDGERAGFRHRAPALGEHDGEIEVSWALPAPAAGATPAEDNPAGATPAEDSPAGDSPAGATPAGASPAGDSPAGATPAGDALPLAGLRVLDFGHGGVGVEAGRLFAEYGADVIKVESRSYPDFIRLVAGSEMSPSFASSSRSKRSMGVNIKTPRGLQIVKDLVAQVDVVIENNSTGTMAELGLDYDTLRQTNPGLVMISSQLMGSTGPWASWLGYGPSTRPAGGMTWLWNFSDGGMPPGAGVIFPDHLVGRVCAIAALAGLLRRGRTGSGGHFEAAQVESVLALMAHFFLQESLEPGSVQPLGNRRTDGAPWGVYQCAGEERWCVITCRDDDDWNRLVKIIANPAWSDDALATVEGRRTRHDEIDKEIAEWTSARSDREVMESLQAAGVPCALVAYASDQPDDPHLRARGYITEVEQPGVGPMVLEGPAFQASRMPRPIIEPAPWLGEHTRAIACDLLGLDRRNVEELIAAGVLEVTDPQG